MSLGRPKEAAGSTPGHGDLVARKIITCTACKARFDVARYPPGSRVRCGRCSQVLTVPIEPGAEKAPKSRRKATPQGPRTGERRGSAPARADAGMAPAPKQGIGGKQSARVTVAAGGRRTPDRDPLLGSTVQNQYKIIRKLGEGGYGAVYEAHDINLERRMAIKVMLRSRAKNREYVTKFMREARTAAQLSHPNVVGVHGVGFDKAQNIHFLAMEYVEGRTFHDILQDSGVMAVDDAVEYVVQACRGLAAAHERNIIHRDIKPGNLMVTPGGVVKIADFGLAKIYDADAAQSTVIGTPYFMPPEQFEGKAKDGRTDIYALGVTFYYMLTLKRPHTGNGPAQILLSVMTKDPKSVCAHRKDLPEGIWPIVLRMIHRDLDKRYAQCDEIIRDLEAFRGGVQDEEEPTYCPGCGVPNPMEAESCTKCGESLLETCPVCGVEDLAGTRFCGDCGANIPEERALGALIAEAKGLMHDGLLDGAAARLEAAEERSPENLAVATARNELEGRREEWRARRNAVRDLLAAGKAPDALDLLDEVRQEFSEMTELDLLEADVKTALAAQDPAAAADAEAQSKARALEDEGRIREALVAWRGVLVLSPDDDEARAGEERLASRVERAEALFTDATVQLSAGDPEAAVECLLEANTILPDDPLIEGRMDEARRAAADLRTELDALIGTQTSDGTSDSIVAQLLALKGRYPASADVADALTEAERAGRQASAEAVRERLAGVLEQGRAADAAGRPREALAAWREACSLDPDDAEAAEGLRRAEAALSEFDGLLQQSRTLLQSGDPDGALERADEALKLVPGDPVAEAQCARCRTNNETLRHEAERIRSALTDEPDDEVLQWAQELAARYSGSSLAAEVLAEVEDAYREQAEKEVGERVQKLVSRAVKLEQEGNVRAALKIFDDAVELAGDDEDARAGRERTQARIDAAEKLATEATKHLEEGAPGAAEVAAKESLDLLPDQREAASVHAKARAAVSEIDRALRTVREDLSAKLAETQLDRAKALTARFPMSLRASQFVMQAEEILATSQTAAAADRVAAALDRARSALAEGRLEDVDTACDEVLAIDADHVDAKELKTQAAARRDLAREHAQAAQAALDDGRADAALELFETAAGDDPTLADARDGVAAARAIIADLQGRIDAAVAAAHAAAPDGPRVELVAWQAVLAIDADHTSAQAAVKRLTAAVETGEAAIEKARERLKAGDPGAAVRPLRDAVSTLPGETGLADELEQALAAVAEIKEAATAIAADLDNEGDLEDVAVRATELAERYPGSAAATRMAERARHAANERRHGLAVAEVRALVREKKYAAAAALAASFREQGIDTPELKAAEDEARASADELGDLRGRLESARAEGRLETARDVCREILHSVPDDADTRELLTELEETLREVAARRDLAETARRRGDVEEALGLYREVLELKPTAERTQAMVARLEAEVEERSTLLDDAEAQLVAGDPDAARRATRKLLDLYPDDDDARDLDATAQGLSRAVSGLISRARRCKEAGNTAAESAARAILARIVPDHPEAKAAKPTAKKTEKKPSPKPKKTDD